MSNKIISPCLCLDKFNPHTISGMMWYNVTLNFAATWVFFNIQNQSAAGNVVQPNKIISLMWLNDNHNTIKNTIHRKPFTTFRRSILDITLHYHLTFHKASQIVSEEFMKTSFNLVPQRFHCSEWRHLLKSNIITHSKHVSMFGPSYSFDEFSLMSEISWQSSF